VRSHGAKCTFIRLATELNIDRRTIRQQGGWLGQKEDLMPDTYARGTQIRALYLQEAVLRHLRGESQQMPDQNAPPTQRSSEISKPSSGKEEPLEGEAELFREEVASSASEPSSTSDPHSDDSDSQHTDPEEDLVNALLVNVATLRYHRPRSTPSAPRVLGTVESLQDVNPKAERWNVWAAQELCSVEELKLRSTLVDATGDLVPGDEVDLELKCPRSRCKSAAATTDPIVTDMPPLFVWSNLLTSLEVITRKVRQHASSASLTP